MKFYLSLALAVTLITITSASAQHTNIGIKAGLNLYNINNDNGVKYDTKAGFHAGLLGHIHLNKQWAIQPELLYSGQGAKYTSAGLERTLNLGYINVPVMVQYMFDNGFRLQAGPQVGFLVSAKSKTNNVTTDVKDQFETVDFALGAGIGYISVKSGLGFDLRYNLGLSDISKSDAVKSTNRGMQLGVFYQFKHK